MLHRLDIEMHKEENGAPPYRKLKWCHRWWPRRKCWWPFRNEVMAEALPHGVLSFPGTT
jgi:hypothetical protein